MNLIITEHFALKNFKQYFSFVFFRIIIILERDFKFEKTDFKNYPNSHILWS